MIGDDSSDSQIKVYTNAHVSSTDRVLKLTGTIHTENGGIVLYSDSGPSPYFDVQGDSGSITTAAIGTVAYAGTLSDGSKTSSTQSAGSFSIQSINPPSTADAGWVYLTGQVVTGVGTYRTNDPLVGAAGSPIYIYYLQGLDRTPGIRVWNSTDANLHVGSIVDVMAQVSTRDGERILGIPGMYDSIESVMYNGINNNKLPSPLFMNNRTLGGMSLGLNPGISGSYGLYNIGTNVKISGKVVGKGVSYADSGYPLDNYIQVDDGSGVPCDGSYLASIFPGNVAADKGIAIFGVPDAIVGDNVTVSGISAVWSPTGPTGATYSSILFPTIKTVSTGGITPPANTGSIAVDLKLYGDVSQHAGQNLTVSLFSSTGAIRTQSITCDSCGTGSSTFNWSNLPSTGSFAISAKCDGFKARVYSSVTNGSNVAVRLTPLRKIILRTNRYDISSCVESNSAELTATVLDANHEPVANWPVRFYTDNGTFSSGGNQKAITYNTDATGKAYAVLYGTDFSSDHNINAFATDDALTPTPDVAECSADDYKLDWEPIQPNASGRNYVRAIGGPLPKLILETDKTEISHCDRATITVHLETCSTKGGRTISLGTSLGTFEGAGPSTPYRLDVITDSEGNATAYLVEYNGETGTANITAYIYLDETPVNQQVSLNIAISEYTLDLSASPYSVPPSQSSSTITATVSQTSGPVPAGTKILFTTTAGTLDGSAGSKEVEVISGQASVTLSNVIDGGFAVVSATVIDQCGDPITKRVQVDFLQSTPDDWPMFMHDSRHQGYNRFYDTTTTETFTEAWTPVPIDTVTSIGSWYNSNHPHPGLAEYPASEIFSHPFIDSSPVHAGGIENHPGGLVFVGGYKEITGADPYVQSQGYLLAIDPVATDDVNRIAWRYPSEGNYLSGGVASTPAVFTVNGLKRVVFGCMDGSIYCLDAATGAFRWSLATESSGNTNIEGIVESHRVLASPVVYPFKYNGSSYEAAIFIGNESSYLYAIDGLTGQKIWEMEMLPRDSNWPDRTGLSSAAITSIGGKNRLFIGSDNGYLYSIDISTGTLIRPAPREDGIWMGGCVESSPTVYAGKVYAGVSVCDGVNFYCFDTCNLALAWEPQYLQAEARPTPAAADNNVYEGVDTGWIFYSMNAATGEIVATFDAQPDALPDEKSYFLSSEAISSAGMVYVGDVNRNFYKFVRPDLSGVQKKMPGAPITSSPALSYAVDDQHNRWIFVTSRSSATGQGLLYAFRQTR